MEEQNIYEIGMDFVEETMGKIIIYRTPSGIIRLNGKMSYDDYVKEQSAEDENGFLRWLDDSGTETTNLVGLHRNISHEGRVLGGADAVYANNTLYVGGTSNEFGKINPGDLEKCLSGKNINLKFARSFEI